MTANEGFENSQKHIKYKIEKAKIKTLTRLIKKYNNDKYKTLSKLFYKNNKSRFIKMQG